MSTSATPAGGYEDSLAAATILMSVPLLYLFSINRRVFPLAQREPGLVIVSISALIFWITFRLFQIGHAEIVRVVVEIANFICLGLVLCVFLLRVWKVYMDAGLTHERAQGRIGWFITHRNLASRKFNVWFTIGVSTIHLILFCTVALLDSDRALEPARDSEQTQASSLILIGVATVYSLIFLVSSFKLAGFDDGFYIKQELRAVGIGTFCALIGWLVQSTLDLPCEVVNCGVLILWSGAVWMLGGALLFPLVIAFLRDPRFRWYEVPTCKRPRRRGESLSRGSSIASRRETELPSPVATPAAVVRTLMPHQQVEKLRKVPLKKFLTSAAGKEAFRAFTVREFSVENLMFVEAVQRLKEKPSISKEDARILMDRYIRAGAPNQVNLPGIIVKKMCARFEEGAVQDLRTMFDEPYNYVMRLMERDAFRRFQASPEWQQHVLVFEDKHPDAPPDEVTQATPAPAQDAPAQPAQVAPVRGSSDEILLVVTVPADETQAAPLIGPATVVAPAVTQTGAGDEVQGAQVDPPVIVIEESEASAL